MEISEEEPVAAEAVDLDWASRFLASLEQGNVEHMLSLLTEDVMFVADGGGKAIAAMRPIHMRDHVTHFLLDGFKKTVQGDLRFEATLMTGIFR
ncbi:hypothetical protein [Paenibacillus sp. UNC496MF]|uniref:hypothetical protein n=1 Tax=Paenibacillus sp. UNC496MF TaxID=1502753 RepID=UPI000B8558C3|nr:hypothetical protein [Paenibacillus sp. UNC496MF]